MKDYILNITIYVYLTYVYVVICVYICVCVCECIYPGFFVELKVRNKVCSHMLLVDNRL